MDISWATTVHVIATRSTVRSERVHVDWGTGEEVGKVILGSNPIFDTADDGLCITRNENDIYVPGVFGPV